MYDVNDFGYWLIEKGYWNEILLLYGQGDDIDLDYYLNLYLEEENEDEEVLGDMECDSGQEPWYWICNIR